MRNSQFLNDLMPLAANGLLMPPEFPVAAFEHSYARIRTRAATHGIFEHFGGAWNALSIRYVALIVHGDAFTRLITQPRGTAPEPTQRAEEESHLFGLFSNGFSAFEAYFYGMFAVGALLRPVDFKLTTAKEQQAVSPTSTGVAYSQVFAGDPVLTAFDAAFQDAAYRELREVRNVLTHRTAPGRRIYINVGCDDELPARWKLNDIELDGQMAASRRAHIARLFDYVAGSGSGVSRRAGLAQAVYGVAKKNLRKIPAHVRAKISRLDVYDVIVASAKRINRSELGKYAHLGLRVENGGRRLRQRL